MLAPITKHAITYLMEDFTLPTMKLYFKSGHDKKRKRSLFGRKTVSAISESNKAQI